MLFIDIRVTLVINIITLRPLYMYNIFLYIIPMFFLYHSFIVVLSFSQYCQICYNLICSTIFNQNLTHVMQQIVSNFFFRWSCDIDIHMFLYGLHGTTYIYFFYYLCVVHNNLIVKYQLCLNILFSVSVSVSVSVSIRIEIWLT